MNEKLKPEQWGERKGITILDPDGWRIDSKPFDEPIEESEYDRRMAVSTIMATTEVFEQYLENPLK